MNVRWIFIAAVLMTSGTLSAQWLNYPTLGIPHTADGKPNLSAPAPRTADGKADLSGLRLIQGPYIGDITRDLEPGDVSFQPWAAELYARRQETLSKDDPTGRCMAGGVSRSAAVPYPFKILNTTGMVRNRGTVTLPLLDQADTELLEYMCNENNKDIEHLVGK
jgi:hypothetical protein